MQILTDEWFTAISYSYFVLWSTKLDINHTMHFHDNLNNYTTPKIDVFVFDVYDSNLHEYYPY